MFGKACCMSLLELLSCGGARFPVTNTEWGFCVSCWKITIIQMQRKWLTYFIREISLPYVLFMTSSNLTGLIWGTLLLRVIVVSSESLSLWQNWLYTAGLLGLAGCSGCLDIYLWAIRTKGLVLILSQGFSSSLPFFPSTHSQHVMFIFFFSLCLHK